MIYCIATNLRSWRYWICIHAYLNRRPSREGCALQYLDLYLDQTRQYERYLQSWPCAGTTHLVFRSSKSTLSISASKEATRHEQLERVVETDKLSIDYIHSRDTLQRTWALDAQVLAGLTEILHICAIIWCKSGVRHLSTCIRHQLMVVLRRPSSHLSLAWCSRK